MTLWKIIIEEDAVLIPKKNEARNFPADFCTRNFLGRSDPLCRHSVALSPRHGDITRFRPWSSIATGNHLDRAEKIRKVAETTGTADVFERIQAFRDPLRGDHPHVQVFMNEGPNPLT